LGLFEWVFPVVAGLSSQPVAGPPKPAPSGSQ